MHVAAIITPKLVWKNTSAHKTSPLQITVTVHKNVTLGIYIYLLLNERFQNF